MYPVCVRWAEVVAVSEVLCSHLGQILTGILHSGCEPICRLGSVLDLSLWAVCCCWAWRRERGRECCSGVFMVLLPTSDC